MLCRSVVVTLLSLATLPNARPSFAEKLRLPAKINYGRDIKPILSDNCYKCHGPDGETRQAGLRLDIRSQAVRTLESGSVVIVPGNPADSEMVRRIESSDEDAVMPPPATHKKPAARQAIVAAMDRRRGRISPTLGFCPAQTSRASCR